MKKPNPRRIILGVMAGLCMYIAFDRCHDFYLNSVPVGAEMSCFDIKYPELKQHLQMRILVNSWQEKGSLVMLKFLPNGNEEWSEQFSFAEQRMLNPKPMDCQ